MKKLLKHLVRLAGLLILLFLFTSFYQVAMYRFVPPLFTNMMARVQVEHWMNGDATTVAYQWKPYKDISPKLAMTVIAAEDQKFAWHWGFDLESIEEALEKNKSGKRMRGASTLTQQVAKNLFLWPGRSYLRKGAEAYYTLLLEALYPKKRILEIYLNIAQMGTATFGAAAASARHYHKDPADLNLQQAARLAAVLPNPARYQASKPGSYVLRRSQWITNQFYQLGGISYLDQL